MATEETTELGYTRQYAPAHDVDLHIDMADRELTVVGGMAIVNRQMSELWSACGHLLNVVMAQQERITELEARIGGSR